MTQQWVSLGPEWYSPTPGVWKLWGRPDIGFADSRVVLLNVAGAQDYVPEPPPPPPPPPPGAEFVYGQTKPVLVDPYNPKSSDNIGWDGNSSGGTITAVTTTIARLQTLSNRIIIGDLIFTDDTSEIENCLVLGSVWNKARSGMLTMTNGGRVTSSTVQGEQRSGGYARNNLTQSGGKLIADRSAFFGATDSIHTTGTASSWTLNGCALGRNAFRNDDNDHSTDTKHPFWTHADGSQVLNAGVGPYTAFGCLVDGFFDTRGVIPSGVWGAAGTTYSGGVLGMPSVALNAGYVTKHAPLAYAGNRSNGLSWTNNNPGFVISVTYCWIDGVDAPSGMVMITTGGTAADLTMEGNRFGLAGYRSGGTTYLIQHPSNTVLHLGTGTKADVYGDFPSVPTTLRGKPITHTADGAKYTGAIAA